MNQIQLLLPEIFDEERKRLTWDQMICTSPTLSLTNDDVLHMMVSAKLEYPKTYAYLLAVNVRSKTVEALERERLGFGSATRLGRSHISYI